MACPPPACPPTNVKFQLRRAIASDWTTKNPILRPGEPGVESDTGQMKIGNESCDTWNNLPYVGSADINALRNLALNAFIWDASVSAVYDQGNKQVNVYTTLYGNSSYYDLTYTCSPSSISTTTAKFINNNSIIYNNLSPTPAPSTTGHNVVLKTIPINSLVTGTNTITVNISTQNAGGIGNYSVKTVSTTVYFSAYDSMGYPLITLSSSNPSFTNTNTVYISGIEYYSNGSIINFPTGSLSFNNIYNIIPYSSLPYNFLTINDESGSSTILENTSKLYYSSSSPFPASSGTNVTYYNTQFSYTLNGDQYSQTDNLTFSLVNAKGLSRSYNEYNIGYIGTNWEASYETNIPLNQTISGVSAITRISISNLESSQPQTPSIPHLVSFNPASITNYDCFYLPYYQQFYADTDLTSLLSGITLPSQTIASNSGVRYLTLQLTNSAVLQSFTVLLGNSNRSPTVHSLHVQWHDSVRNTYYGWYDASVAYTNSGGCQNGVSGNSYAFQISINVADQTTYNLSSGASGGNIWINVGFSGSININDINVV